MTQVLLFGGEPEKVAPRPRKKKDAPPPPPPKGPERTSDADDFEARLVKTVTLRPYQRVGARWLSERRSGLLADEPGVGKTPTVVAAIPRGAPVVVVCPAVARDGVWPRHLAWRPDLRVRVVRSKKDFTWPVPAEVVVVNYELLPDHLDVPLAAGVVPAGLVVALDEGHMAKNPQAKRAIRVTMLCAAAREAGGHSWIVTGTPLKNRPLDLWHLLGVAGLQGATWRTERRFCRAFGRSPETFEWTGQVEPEVPDVLRRVMLRRELSEVVKDMPPRQWEELQVEINHEAAAAATKAVEALAAAGIDLATATRQALLDQKHAPAAVGELMRARVALATAKIPALLELLDAHEEESDRPILVFSAHRAPIDAASSRPGWGRVSGDESPAARARLEAEFQAGKLKGLALTIKAGGTAITLTRARRAIFCDREWTPADNEQAEGRIFRADELTRASREPVLYTDLVADHVIDRRLAQLLATKRDVAAASVGAASVGAGASTGVPVEPSASVAHEGSIGLNVAAPAVGGVSQIALHASEVTTRTTARASSGRATDKTNGRRPARTPIEFWAEDGLAVLARHGGVSKFDAPLLARCVSDLAGGLDESRWSGLVKVCRRYVSIVGAPPAQLRAS